jgi:glucose/arabinose dehydrogenase
MRGEASIPRLRSSARGRPRPGPTLPTQSSQKRHPLDSVTPIGAGGLGGQLPKSTQSEANRAPPAEPKLLRIAFDDASAPVGARDFVSGWQDAAGNRWGRPAGIVVAPDGSLIVSDDQSGLLYRLALS